MIQIVHTNSTNPDFKALVQALDAELATRDGSEHSFYNQFNKIDTIKYAVVAYADGIPVACGAIKEQAPGTMEVKRMYTKPEHRGKRIAAYVLSELETWARELACHTCILETGKRQPEAIRLYEKNHYIRIPNYGQYTGVDNSVCFEKKL
jgi:putative acetyltransferase